MIHGHIKHDTLHPAVVDVLDMNHYDINGSVVRFYRPGASVPVAVVDVHTDECSCEFGKKYWYCPHIDAARFVLKQEQKAKEVA